MNSGLQAYCAILHRGRTARELSEIFQKLPEAQLYLDLRHCRQVDPTMNESYLILQQFGARLGQLHVSEVNSRSTHDPLSDAAVSAFEKIAFLIPECTRDFGISRSS